MPNLKLCMVGFAVVTQLLAIPASAQTASAKEEVVRLYEGVAPGDWKLTVAETIKNVPLPGGVTPIVSNVSDPTFTVVRPAQGKANGSAMIVLPGGAFAVLAWDLEGLQVANWFADRGITAFVLKYRVRDLNLPVEEIKRAPSPFDRYLEVVEPGLRIAAGDAQQAVRLVRRDAAKYGIDPTKIGMIGFSAGAITTIREVATADPATRPDLVASIYGAALKPPAVTSTMPPLFIVAARDDASVPVQKSLALHDAWLRGGAPVEMLITEDGGHGFGLGRPGTTSKVWPSVFEGWLKAHGFIPGDSALRR